MTLDETCNTIVQALATGDANGFEQIELMAQKGGTRVRRVRLPKEDSWTIEDGAVIAFQSSGSHRNPVALLPGTHIDRKLASTLSSEAYFFSRPIFSTWPFRLADLSAHLIFGNRQDGIAILILSGIACALGLALPLLTAKTFEQVVPYQQRGNLLTMIGAMLIVVSVLQLAEFIANIIRLRLKARLSHTLKASIMDRMLALPTGFFRSYSVGELLLRSGVGDSEQERLLLSAFSGIFSGLVSVSSLFVLFWFDPRIGFIALSAGGGALLVAAWGTWKKWRLERKVLESTTRLRSLLLQILAGITKIRAAGAESWLFARWAGFFHERQLLGLASSRINNSAAVFHSALPLACMALFMLVLGEGDRTPGAGGATVHQFTPGRYLAIVTSFTLYMNGLWRLGTALSDLACAAPLIERARPILSAPLEQNPLSGPCVSAPTPRSGSMELRRISFRYSPQSPLVLDQVNIRIKPAQFVALVGPSGSGKSTLVRLLLGFEKPTDGQILYDEDPLNDLNILSLRRQIGTVLQNDHLVSGNVFENIAAVRSLTLDQAWEAARIAGLEEDLLRWPMGLHSFVTHGGAAFSGGERQRLMIARAVAGQPRILILDEATSALDNRVQAQVMRNLEALKITRIVVAHRLSTIRSADLILVFDRGRVVERGTYASLMARGGIFALLARRQSMGEDVL